MSPSVGHAGGHSADSPAQQPLPPWVQRLVAALPDAGAEVAALLRARERAARAEGIPVGSRSGREAAVLVLLGPGVDGAGDLVLLERAAGLRTHAGQVAFPGGGLDAGDGGDPVQAALREAREEVGLDPDGVQVLGAMAALHVPPTGARVVPVLAWQPDPVEPVVGDAGEVARVMRVPLPALTDPAARAVVRTSSGWTGPTFTLAAADRLVVWGFTAAVLDVVLRLAGLERPWDATRELPLSAVSGAPVPPAGGGAVR